MVFNGFFSKPSKNLPVKKVETDVRSMYSADMSQYTQACEKDPELKSFDLLLHQETNKAISSLIDRAKAQPLSIDSLAEVYASVPKMYEDALTLIIKNREYVRKNKDLKALVDIYFKSSSMTYSFCKTVENCIKRAEESQLILQLAVKEFEKESVESGEENKYAKTVEGLIKFKAMGDPFDGNFLHLYADVYSQQVLLLKELREQNVRLDKKHKNAKVWMKVTNVIFITALISFLVLSVTLAAVAEPELLSALASAMTHPTEYAGKWCSELWMAYETTMERERGMALSMELQTIINKEAMKHLVEQVEKLRSTIASILGFVEFAIEKKEEDHAMKLAMQEIKRKVGTFEWRIRQATDLVAFGRYTLGIP